MYKPAYKSIKNAKYSANLTRQVENPSVRGLQLWSLDVAGHIYRSLSRKKIGDSLDGGGGNLNWTFSVPQLTTQNLIRRSPEDMLAYFFFVLRTCCYTFFFFISTRFSVHSDHLHCGELEHVHNTS